MQTLMLLVVGWLLLSCGLGVLVGGMIRTGRSLRGDVDAGPDEGRPAAVVIGGLRVLPTPAAAPNSDARRLVRGEHGQLEVS